MFGSFPFEIKIVCFKRLIESFYLLFFELLAIRHKILSSDYCVTDKLGPLQIILPFQHATFARRTAHGYFVLASKELMLEGFTTFMDCCLRTRASNVVRNEVDYLGGID